MSKSKNTKKKNILPDTQSETKLNEAPGTSASSSVLDTGIIASRKSSKKEDPPLDSADSSSDYMKNSILEEILNEKKAALLQSPEVMNLLRQQQLKLQK
ncbi:hypothetical protein JTE90_025108 [Oedothorax gibbosus]|uniref:Regulatory factor X-associated protein RFXANK-binding domain-containing protein n=1 Tax=Oedothorax gibbosus TaxID=931172 RepID=A0AAV6U3Q2_9ARAC|nr:hypothetical protein JTE90_025108 [Oedothorax gibbosus]